MTEKRTWIVDHNGDRIPFTVELLDVPAHAQPAEPAPLLAAA